jgi:hypothetical protein
MAGLVSNTGNTDNIADIQCNIEAELAELQSHGVLQPNNCMNVNFLLNPPEESGPGVDNSTTTEIYDDVAATFSWHDIGNSMNNTILTADACKKPIPTKKEALDTLETIRQYVKSMNTDAAQQMELACPSLHFEIHSKQNISTQISLDSFFTRK